MVVIFPLRILSRANRVTLGIPHPAQQGVHTRPSPHISMYYVSGVFLMSVMGNPRGRNSAYLPIFFTVTFLCAHIASTFRMVTG